jgi:hypothetical protein
MKIKTILACFSLALLTACGGSTDSSVAEENKNNSKPYEDSLAAFIKENKDQLDSMFIKLETFATDINDGKHKINYKFVVEDSVLNFQLYQNNNNPLPVKGFNAIYLSENVLQNKPLPTNMPSDFFIPVGYNYVRDLVKTGKYDRGYTEGTSGLIECLQNDKKLLKTFLQLKYLVLIKYKNYTPGSVSTIIDTYNIPVLEGVLYIYNLKTNKYCGGGEFSSSGASHLNYTYKENDIADEQYQAEKEMVKETPDSILFKTIRLLNEFTKVDDSSIKSY